MNTACVSGGKLTVNVAGSSETSAIVNLIQDGGEVVISSSGTGIGYYDNSGSWNSGVCNITAGKLTVDAAKYGVATLGQTGGDEYGRYTHMNFAGGEAYITGGVQALKYNYTPVFSPGAMLRTGESKELSEAASGYYGEKFIQVFVVREIIVTPSGDTDSSGNSSDTSSGSGGSGGSMGTGAVYPSTLPFETILGLGGEGTYSDIKALDSPTRDVTNQAIFAYYYAAMLGKNAEIIATKDLYAPYGVTASWKASQRLIIWKNLGLLPGDEVYIVWYCQEAHDMRFIKAFVSDTGAVYAYIPCLGSVSTVSIVRLGGVPNVRSLANYNMQMTVPQVSRISSYNLLNVKPMTLTAPVDSDGEPIMLVKDTARNNESNIIWCFVILFVLMFLLYYAFSNGYGGMSETKKTLVIRSLKKVSLKYGRPTQIMAVVLAFFVLLYYHLIGKHVIPQQNELSKLRNI